MLQIHDLTLTQFPQHCALSIAAEAAGWERLARALHEEAPTGGLGAAPETVFGSLDALTVGSRDVLLVVPCSVEPHWAGLCACSVLCSTLPCDGWQPGVPSLPLLNSRADAGKRCNRHDTNLIPHQHPQPILLATPPACVGQGPAGARRGGGPHVPPRAAVPAVARQLNWFCRGRAKWCLR